MVKFDDLPWVDDIVNWVQSNMDDIRNRMKFVEAIFDPDHEYKVTMTLKHDDEILSIEDVDVDVYPGDVFPDDLYYKPNDYNALVFQSVAPLSMVKDVKAAVTSVVFNLIDLLTGECVNKLYIKSDAVDLYRLRSDPYYRRKRGLYITYNLFLGNIFDFHGKEFSYMNNEKEENKNGK